MSAYLHEVQLDKAKKCELWAACVKGRPRGWVLLLRKGGGGWGRGGWDLI